MPPALPSESSPAKDVVSKKRRSKKKNSDADDHQATVLEETTLVDDKNEMVKIRSAGEEAAIDLVATQCVSVSHALGTLDEHDDDLIDALVAEGIATSDTLSAMSMFVPASTDTVSAERVADEEQQQQTAVDSLSLA